MSLYYRYSTFGPIYAKDDQEVNDISVLFEDKIKRRNYIDKYGGHYRKKFTKSKIAKKARKSLPPDVVEYLDLAFYKEALIKKKYYSQYVERNSIKIYNNISSFSSVCP